MGKRKSGAFQEDFLKISSGRKGATQLENEVYGISVASGLREAEILKKLCDLSLGGGCSPMSMEQRTRPRICRIHDDDTED